MGDFYFFSLLSVLARILVLCWIEEMRVCTFLPSFQPTFFSLCETRPLPWIRSPGLQTEMEITVQKFHWEWPQEWCLKKNEGRKIGKKFHYGVLATKALTNFTKSSGEGRQGLWSPHIDQPLDAGCPWRGGHTFREKWLPLIKGSAWRGIQLWAVSREHPCRGHIEPWAFTLVTRFRLTSCPILKHQLGLKSVPMLYFQIPRSQNLTDCI